MKYSTIHDLPSDERPRERLVRLGPEALSIQELFAILLQGGMKGKSVMALSQELINEFGNPKNIANASVAELSKITGIGTAKAIQIKAAFELGKRLSNYKEDKFLGIVKNADDVFNILKSRLKGKKKRTFLCSVLEHQKSCKPGNQCRSRVYGKP